MDVLEIAWTFFNILLLVLQTTGQVNKVVQTNTSSFTNHDSGLEQSGHFIGTNLWCYECRENYKEAYIAQDAPCSNNLSQIMIRQCGPRDKYCWVERLEMEGNVLMMKRGCKEQCFWGCRFNGYGLTYMKCTSCCRNKRGCNDDNGARAAYNHIPLLLGLVLGLRYL